MSKRLLACALLPMAAVLSGCSPTYDHGDLRAYMDEVYARPKGRVEPIPQEVVYEPFTYQAAAMRSPFQPPVRIDPSQRNKGSKDLKPDETRVKQFLEGFNIETFTMVGTLTRDNLSYALIQAGDGVHRVKVGDYLGRNYGKIVSIKPAEINVTEIVPDGDGGWLERPRSLMLQEREK